jgi:UDP-2,3-diacylglucosamine hydrolase
MQPDTMNKIFFISDIHLGGQPQELEQEKKAALFRFFAMVRSQNATLVLLGDLFDLWFEYKHAIPKEHADTICELMQLRKAGIDIHFVLGNHDFWIDDFFRKTLDIHVYPDPVTIDLAGKTFHFHHGDGIDASDKGYRLLKRVFRFRPNIVAYRWLHPDIGLPFAKKISGSSRKYTSQKPNSNDTDYTEYARARIAEGANFVLMGHRHQPKTEKIDTGIYVNTGDWLFHRSYAEFNGETLELKTWK